MRVRRPLQPRTRDRGARDRTRPRGPYRTALIVALVGLAVTVALTAVSHSQYTSNEKRLLDLRVKELGAALAGALPNTEIPLTAAATLADATDGHRQKFDRYIARYVGTRAQFIAASLWHLGSGAPVRLSSVGTPLDIGAAAAELPALFARAAAHHKLQVSSFLQSPRPGLGYVVASPASPSRFAVYAQTALPANRRSRLERNTAFSDLDYAIYLGATPRAGQLLLTNLTHLPMSGPQARTVLPFGDSALTLLVSARVPLGGTLPQRLPWIILIVGAILSLGAAALTARLIHGRHTAEGLAGQLAEAVRENQQLYTEQRNIAQTLQRALLPGELPQVAGAEAGGRYEPGVQGIDIGGDWYDVIPLDERRLLAVVGDVSGRGLRAAATMASLRYAIHAYAAQSDPPDAILSKLSQLLQITTTGQFATVLCARIDVPGRQVTVASAGHLPPLLLSNGHGDYLVSDVGPPIGVQTDARYTPMTVGVPSTGTLLAFTDGLIERRGESIDEGLARLREHATAQPGTLTALLDRLVGDLRPDAANDDTAIVGLRWTA